LHGEIVFKSLDLFIFLCDFLLSYLSSKAFSLFRVNGSPVRRMVAANAGLMKGGSRDSSTL